MKLEDECGVTDISLKNAIILLTTLNKPNTVILTYNEQDQEWYVEVKWPNYNHIFTGFSWSYYGTGPQGLYIFLNEMLNISVQLHEIAFYPKGEFTQTFQIKD